MGKSLLLSLFGVMGGCAAPASSGTASVADPLSTFTIEIDPRSAASFGAEADALRELTLDALTKVQRVRAVSDARIVLASGPRVIPEIGLGSWVVGPARVLVVVDTSRDGWLESFRTWIPSIVAHELSHMIRERYFVSAIDPMASLPPEEEERAASAFKAWMRGRPPTLGDFVIHEGYADHFAMQVAGDGPYPWDLALDDAQLKRLTQYVRDHWDDEEYDREAWVTGNDEIPRMAAYTVGYHLVAARLAGSGDLRPSDLMLSPASEFRGTPR